MNNALTLNDLFPGESAVIQKLLCANGIRRRLLDIGLTEGARVTCVGHSPSRDPKAFLIRGAVIALREEDLKNISITDKEFSYEIS